MALELHRLLVGAAEGLLQDEVLDRRSDGYKGPITPASSAVAANYTIVDMFASVATGNATPEAAAKMAAKQAERYYKS